MSGLPAKQCSAPIHRFRLAYIFGSFVTRDSFRDIDIAVLFSGKQDSCALFDLQMSKTNLSPRVPCDVRALNHAPVEFCFEVTRTGTVLFCRSTDQKASYEADIIREVSRPGIPA
ncbi:MAG: hypothetical protein APR55_08665 [Methanolinea sp. SDB]|nr:MAG: hypothetical protein APR55_08665 [Methanolinea sp. SDB]